MREFIFHAAVLGLGAEAMMNLNSSVVATVFKCAFEFVLQIAAIVMK